MFFKTHVRWVPLISNLDFENNYFENKITSIIVERLTFLITKYKNNPIVFSENCPHQGVSLKHGLCKNGQVICPWHKYAFCLKSGKDLSSSGSALKIYQVKLENDFWYVGWEEKTPFWMDTV